MLVQIKNNKRVIPSMHGPWYPSSIWYWTEYFIENEQIAWSCGKDKDWRKHKDYYCWKSFDEFIRAFDENY